MKINVQFVKIPTSDFLESFVIKELMKIAKKYDWVIKADVFYKLEKDPKGKGRICEIQLSHPGPRTFATSNEESFELATDETLRDIKIQLKKRKSEMKPYI